MSGIRLANENDAAGILEIYRPYIEHTSFTFETETPSIEDFQKRIDTYVGNWPWLVCEIDGMIAGYAYGGKHRERTAYQWCLESSVYVHDNFHRMGIARALYSALIEMARLQGYRNLYAVINLPNEKSVSFHEQMGFQYFATYKNVGYKLGRWKNVGWWELQLNEYSDDPPPPVKFSLLDAAKINSIIRESEKLLKLSKE